MRYASWGVLFSRLNGSVMVYVVIDRKNEASRSARGAILSERSEY